MSRRPARCTEADLKRAVKAAGDRTVRVLPDGTIEIAPIRPQEAQNVPHEPERVIVL